MLKRDLVPRILFYTENYVLGGADDVLLGLVDGMAAAGWDVRLAWRVHREFPAMVARKLKHPVLTEEVEVPTSVPWIRRVDGLRLPKAIKRGLKAPFVAGRYLLLPQHRAILRRLIRRHRPDVLHINNGGYPGGHTCWSAARVAREEGVSTVVATLHNAPELLRPPFSALERCLDTRFIRDVTAVATGSHEVREALIARRGFPPELVHAIPHGIDLTDGSSNDLMVRAARRAEWGLGSFDFVFGTVAHFEPRKGYAVLVESIRRKRTALELLRARFVFVGDGPLLASIRTILEETGLKGTVVTPGFRSDFPELLHAFDCFVLPSVAHEDFPIVNVAAMAAGLPVVGTRLAGMQEQVMDGVTGRLVPTQDPESLGEALVALAADTVRAAAMGRAARVMALERWSVERMVRDYRKLFG